MMNKTRLTISIALLITLIVNTFSHAEDFYTENKPGTILESQYESDFDTYPVANTKSFKDIYTGKSVYSDILNQLRVYNQEYKDITRLFSIGKSIEGRELMVLKVGRGDKKIFINGEHHASEYMTAILVLNQLEYLLALYNEDKSVSGVSMKELLGEVSFYFMPMVNPDGLEICTNKDPKHNSNARRVNLNRNYDANWDKLSAKKNTDSYKGPKPFSEPETQAVKYLCETTDFKVSIAYHAAGNVIFWYYGQNKSDEVRDKKYADILSKTTGYRLVSKGESKEANGHGGFKDWVIKKQHKTAFTIEILKGILVTPRPFNEYEDVWKRNRDIPSKLAIPLTRASHGKSSSEKFKLVYQGTLLRTPEYKDVNGEIYIPVSSLTGFKGLSVEADCVKIDELNVLMKFTGDDKAVLINEVPVIMSEPAVEIDGKLHIPAKFFSDILNLTVDYETESKTLYISGKVKIELKENIL